MIGGILKLPNEDPRKIVFVALALCFVCSLVVSTAAVSLRPLQQANAELDRKKNILVVSGLMEPGVDIEQRFADRVETRLVDLQSGDYSEDLAVESYDQRAASRDRDLSNRVPSSEDVASIGRRARYAPVYLVRDGDQLDQLIIPVHGYGLWSTMYGYLSLKSDLRTVAGITFYDHAETPGLGGEIDNPIWQERWVGKQIVDDAGNLKIRVIKGPVDAASADAQYQIDGISGSTLTGNGVSHMLEFWLGANGFGPFLETIQDSGV